MERVSDERLAGLIRGTTEGRGFYGDTDTVDNIMFDLRDARAALALTPEAALATEREKVRRLVERAVRAGMRLGGLAHSRALTSAELQESHYCAARVLAEFDAAVKP